MDNSATIVAPSPVASPIEMDGATATLDDLPSLEQDVMCEAYACRDESHPADLLVRLRCSCGLRVAVCWTAWGMQLATPGPAWCVVCGQGFTSPLAAWRVVHILRPRGA